MSPAGWITFLGVVITGLLGLVGAWTSSRANRRTAERTAELESIKLQIQAREEQIKSWRQDAESLRQERDQDRTNCDRKVADLREQIRVLMVRLRVPTEDE